LVTGAAGFVGKWLCLELLAQGHDVIGAVRDPADLDCLTEQWRSDLAEVTWIDFELLSGDSVEAALSARPDAIVHLAAIASGAAARANPLEAWRVNCLGTCGLIYALERSGQQVRLLVASTGEVYGGQVVRPALETDRLVPCSPYAASKLGAELATLEYWRRTSGDVVVVRPFAQTGPGQGAEYVVPAFAGRILKAKRLGVDTVSVGSLAPVREFVDVRDVATALAVLIENGLAGEVYNIAQGRGTSLDALFALISDEAEWHGTPVADPVLFRDADIPYLVGDGSKLARFGWKPDRELRDTIRDLLSGVGY